MALLSDLWKTNLSSGAIASVGLVPAGGLLLDVWNKEVYSIDKTGALFNIGGEVSRALKANLTSPTFTGNVGLPVSTTIGSVTSTEIAYIHGVTTNIQSQINLKSTIYSPTFTGSPSAPTPSIGDNSTKLATTAFVSGGLSTKLNSSTYYTAFTYSTTSAISQNISVYLKVGTYNLGIIDSTWYPFPANATFTQSRTATVLGNAAIAYGYYNRTGGSGFGYYISTTGIGASTFTISVEGWVNLNISAPAGSATQLGTTVNIQRM